jgi:predicted CXXCH cytochrome family protein
VIAIILAAACTVAVPARAQTTGKAAMLGGKHDVRATGNTGDVCAGCHTPHAANTSYKALLWNRSSVPTTFQPYDGNPTTGNPDFKGGTISLGAGSATSLLCMSCHDGANALNAVIDTPSGTAFSTAKVTGNSALSTDLSNDHPVGFVYDLSVNGGVKVVATPDGTKVKLFGSAPNRRVECGSCHDAHTTAGGFLRSANTNSALCLACHT